MVKNKNKKNKNIRREDTWLGYRPSIMQARKNDTKKDRQEQKKKCKEYINNEKENIDNI